VNGEPSAGPDAWFKSAAKRPGTWWEAWADWTIERSGEEVPVPPQLGSSAHPPLQQAPGLYVRDLTAG
jgi:polyhydroxyalkanoate synthase